ncbi:MAG: hypothetical protein JXJ19_08195 [Elusimicrobia bacterium]|nr:hypothetical protein [Elusimicrobiota bacterium]
MKKILTALCLIMAAISFYIMVGRNGTDIKLWLTVSFAPFMVISAVAIMLNNGFLQMIILPFLLVYGFGSVFNVPWAAEYAYAHICGILVLTVSAYSVFRHMIRLRFVKIAVGIAVGCVLFISSKYYQRNYLSAVKIKKITDIEKSLLFR